MPVFERDFCNLVGPALEELKTHSSDDDEAIKAINDRSLSLTDREEKVKKWIDDQRAHRFAGGAGPIAPAIVNFADQRQRLARGCGYAAILEQFETIYELCSAVGPKNKDGRGRDLTSFTSKALWVCYPDIVPIYDDYAESALKMLSKVMPPSPRAGETQCSQAAKKYAPFLDNWLHLYARLAPVLRTAAATANYPYDVRVLDKMLWLWGEPSYGLKKGAQSKSKQAARAHKIMEYRRCP